MDDGRHHPSTPSGQSRDGTPKPMIVKFNRWKDKTTILSNRKFRDDLENQGIKVVNDSTQNQTEIVAAAKGDGKVAFFKKGKLNYCGTKTNRFQDLRPDCSRRYWGHT